MHFYKITYSFSQQTWKKHWRIIRIKICTIGNADIPCYSLCDGIQTVEYVEHGGLISNFWCKKPKYSAFTKRISNLPALVEMQESWSWCRYIWLWTRAVRESGNIYKCKTGKCLRHT